MVTVGRKRKLVWMDRKWRITWIRPRNPYQVIYSGTCVEKFVPLAIKMWPVKRHDRGLL